MFKSETVTKIAGALLKAQKEMGNAVKDSKNPFFKSKFADLNSVREAVTPALHAHGITLLQPINENVVETILLHESGEFLGSTIKIVCKEENNPQAYGSAVSYARRYGLSSMLSVGAEDNDAEGAMDRSQSSLSRVGKPVAAVKEQAAPNGTAIHQAQSTVTSNAFGSFRKGSS